MIDQRSYEVGGEQVRGELNALKLRLDRVRQCADGEGLGEPRHTFDEDVAVAQQADEELLHKVRLADDDLAHFIQQRRDKAAFLFYLTLQDIKF
ncbi:MAG: hypothetical protein JW395_2475 [Nitrospira sp.]|nr:hypothetical protein [Nitrospira sp.]